MHWESSLTTLNGILQTPLRQLSAESLSPLFWYAYSQMTPYSYPNVLYVDYLGSPYLHDQIDNQTEAIAVSQQHMTGLAMAINLYLASENCVVGGGRIHSKKR